MIIQAQGISYRTGAVQILDEIDLRFDAGSRTVLLGPNGAGKSTLMRILSGFIAPSSGQVLVDDAPLSGMTLSERARCMSVMTQRNQLDFPFRAEEVIAMGLIPRDDDRRDIVESLLSELEIDADRSYTSLSGGEKQLVQLSRVFAQAWETGERGFLLLDEPMTALDLRHQQQIVSLLGRFSSQGTGQIIVMHDINLAAEIADEIVLMKSGTVIGRGRPQEVMTAGNLEETFSTPMQVLGDSSQPYYRARLE